MRSTAFAGEALSGAELRLCAVVMASAPDPITDHDGRANVAARGHRVSRVATGLARLTESPHSVCGDVRRDAAVAREASVGAVEVAVALPVSSARQVDFFCHGGDRGTHLATLSDGIVDWI